MSEIVVLAVCPRKDFASGTLSKLTPQASQFMFDSYTSGMKDLSNLSKRE